MSNLLDGQRLRIAGLSGSLFFCALLTACGQAAPRTAAPSPSHSPVAAVKTAPTLLGRWRSTTDPLSELEITSTLYTEKYQGKSVAVSTYQVATKCGCPEEKQLVYKTPTILTTRNREDGDCYCYLIEQLTPTTMRLANYGQGGFHSFKRLK
ncbi:hypothetical protein FNT36_14910 [Hymenobacter setariae]|uniref:Uncharacterized protein n=1 Tax=Hymenobacter setariae TaxID=2594794 RepID=A0A558BR13_9BACT|nr:hypothetical protein [Hymenobacter setariae]TVT38960.1 hypothetical protein FNT36_14910 [Hymenobacter setariae]